MKCQSFCEFLFNNASIFLKGWVTGRFSEVQAQVDLDSIIKTRFGFPIARPEDGGIVIGEQPYGLPGSKETVDFKFEYGRTKQKYDFRYINTEYYIELKVQSGGSGNFAGLSWTSAIDKDCEKLSRRMKYNYSSSFQGGNQIDRRRYFACVIAFDIDTMGDIGAKFNDGKYECYFMAGCGNYNGENYPIAVLVREVTYQG